MAFFRPELKIPNTRDVASDTFDVHEFRNQLPGDDTSPSSTHADTATSSSSDRFVQAHGRRSVISWLFWPVVATTVPIALLSGSLLLLVFRYEVHTVSGLFHHTDELDGQFDRPYILVNYSATRIVFAASFLSTLAPILASFVMALWSLRVSQSMREASLNQKLLQLPTPYQLSLVVGITLASTDRLRAYFNYVFSRSRKTNIPPVLNHAAMIFSFSILLATAVFATDAALHYSTSTVEFDQLTPSVGSSYEFGRGLSARCANFNRSNNFGFPCSYDDNSREDVFQGWTEINEIFHLSQNDSSRSEIRQVAMGLNSEQNIAILITNFRSIPSGVDFRASTIGVSTACSLVTQECQPRSVVGSALYTQFNCSDNFYGVLGMTPIVNDTGAAEDPNVSPLAFKPSPSMDYAFFKDAGLDHLYNPLGYDASSWINTLAPYTDSELLNPVYTGFAGRFSISSEAAGSTLHEQRGFFSPEGQVVVDFVVSCEISTYDADYSWVDGDIVDTTSSLSPNGTLFELYHARQFYVSLGNSNADFANMILRSAITNSSDDFIRTWENLYSTKVLATIGAYTSPRTNLEQQNRTKLLVAKVPKPALGALVACSLAYTILGVYLGIAAYRASSEDVRDLAAQLSLAGLTAEAFNERSPSSHQQSMELRNGKVFDGKPANGETRRVVVQGNPNNRSGFDVWV